MSEKAIEEFAKEHGYDTAEYLCEWRGYKCYEPIFIKDADSFIGLPLLILEDSDGNLRMSTPEEAMQQLNECD